LRRFDGDARFQAGNNPESRVRLARTQLDRVHLLDRNEDLSRATEAKFGRQNADYGATHGVEDQLPA
jgi:hypothetical protein